VSVLCGRYARIHSLVDFVAPLGVDLPRNSADRLAMRDPGPRYNVAPGTGGWIVRLDAAGDLAVDECPWSFPTSRGNRINVRGETAHRVPEYREWFAYHRCVVLASGFYEPQA
jgi:putative SOS response-associated peptidase YedK